LLALLPAPAHAKKSDFYSGIPFGLGFQAGIAPKPSTDLVTKPQSTSSGFSHYFAFEPFLDFGNFELRLTGQFHFLPVVSGSGTDATGAYSENSDASIFLYGAHLLLVPYVSETKTSRAYIKLGYSLASASGKNTRTYTASGNVYTEKFDGHTQELLFGAGFEFFLAQNYSLQFEAGARQMEFNRLSYTEGTDLTGRAQSSGAPLLTSAGANKALKYTGAYGSVGLNLNF
jgi:hypothetical protein